MIGEVTSIVPSLLLDLNTNYLDNILLHSLKRKLPMFYRQKGEDIGKILGEEITDRLKSNLTSEKNLSQLKKEILMSLNTSLEYKDSKYELIGRLIRSISYNLNIMILGIFKEREISASVVEIISQKMADNFSADCVESIIVSIVNKIRKQYGTSVGNYESIYRKIVEKHIDSTITKLLQQKHLDVEKLSTEIAISVVNNILASFNDIDKELANSVTSSISSQVAIDTFDKITELSNDLSIDSDFWLQAKTILEQNLGQTLRASEIDELALTIFPSTLFEKYKTALNNLQEKMVRMDNKTHPILNADMASLLIIGNPEDYSVLEQYANSIGEEDVSKPLILDIKKFLYSYGEFRRAYLDYKNSFNNILKAMLGDFEKELTLPEDRAILKERKNNFQELSSDIFNTTDMILFIQTLNSKYFSFVKCESISNNDIHNKKGFNIDEYDEGNFEYFVRMIKSIDLRKSNNPAIARLALNYLKLQIADRKETPIEFRKYMIKIKILELCYSIVPMLEASITKLTEEISYTFIDIDIKHSEIISINDNLLKIKELYEKLFLHVNIDLDKNDDTVMIVKDINDLVSEILVILSELIKRHEPVNLPFDSLWRVIRNVNTTIKSLIGGFEGYLPDSFYSSWWRDNDDLDRTPEDEQFTTKYRKNYINHKDFQREFR